MLLHLGIVLGLISSCIAQCDCPDDNKINSRDNPEDISLTGPTEQETEQLQELLTGTRGVPLDPSSGFTIRASITPSTLLICRLQIEARDFDILFLEMYDAGGVLIENATHIPPPNNNEWLTCNWEFDPPVTGVESLSITTVDDALEVGVRRLEFEACVETGWCPWGSCDVTCGPGVRTRECNCPNPNPDRFVCDPPGPTEEPCEDTCCPNDPSWGDWSDWSSCDVTCGDGNRRRTRTCEADDDCPSCQGANCLCDGENTETQEMSCGNPTTDSMWGSWGQWSDCDVTCGDGTKERSRTCEPDGDCPSCQGADCLCDGENMQTQEMECGNPTTDPMWGDWGQWSDCSVTCGNGIKERTRICEPYGDCPSCQGTNCLCDGKNMETQEMECGNPTTGAKWGDWGPWSECSGECNTGKKTRYRECEPYGECPNCSGDDCECQGNNKEKMDCEGECTETFVNKEHDQFYTKAEYNQKKSNNALKGKGTWNSKVHRQTWWMAGIKEGTCCFLYSIEFTYRCIWQILIEVYVLGASDWITIQTIYKPDDVEDYDWVQSGVIVLPPNTLRVKLWMWPTQSWDAFPQLKDVEVVICCSGEPAPCVNKLTNEDLVTSASRKSKKAKKALLGTHKFWTPKKAKKSYWYALTENGCCGMYTIQFEVYKTWKVEIFVKMWHSHYYILVETVDTMASGWFTTEVIILDHDLPEPRNIEGVKLAVWPAVDDGVYHVPELRNVDIKLCCDEDSHNSKGDVWWSDSHGGSWTSWNPWNWGGGKH